MTETARHPSIALLTELDEDSVVDELAELWGLHERCVQHVMPNPRTCREHRVMQLLHALHRHNGALSAVKQILIQTAPKIGCYFKS